MSINSMFSREGGSLKLNSLGYQQVTSTLTQVVGQVVQQKFFEVDGGPANFVPMIAGQGAFKRTLLQWRSFLKSEGFEAGIMSNATNNAETQLVDAAFDAIQIPVTPWSKKTTYNVFEIEEAMAANNLFSLIEQRELARKKEWDLGIQKVAFKGYGTATGLLNNSSATLDTSNLTKRLSAMSGTELNTFVGKVIGLYRENCAYTAMPTHFVIPEADANGLWSYPTDYMLKTRWEILEQGFKAATGNSEFKLLRCAYCDKANFDGTNNRYALYKYDPTTLVMHTPVAYQSTAAGSSDGFNWSSVAFGSFTGVTALRDKEIYYFGNTAS